MAHWKSAVLFATPVVAAGIAIVTVAGTVQAQATGEEESFPQGLHYLLPPPVPLLSDPDRSWNDERVAYGAVGSEGVLEQPIHYSHKLHAGKLNIDCQYCHFNARKSKHAGVPPTGTCMGCHEHVPDTGRSDAAKADLAKLKDYHEKGEPIPWVKVHDLPDFVYFTHKRHVKAGVACQECHGEVQDDMTVAYRVNQLSMGWCLNCHKSHPSIEENYGAEAQQRRAEIKDCWTCHQ